LDHFGDVVVAGFEMIVRGVGRVRTEVREDRMDVSGTGEVMRPYRSDADRLVLVGKIRVVGDIAHGRWAVVNLTKGANESVDVRAVEQNR